MPNENCFGLQLCIRVLGAPVNSAWTPLYMLAHAVGPECGACLTGPRLMRTIPLYRLRFLMCARPFGMTCVLPSPLVSIGQRTAPIRADPLELEMLAIIATMLRGKLMATPPRPPLSVFIM